LSDPKGPTPDRSPPARPALLGDSLSPGLSLDRIGQALAAFYDDLIAEGVPEHLATLVRQVQPEPGAKPKSDRLALVVEDDEATRHLAEALLGDTDLGVIGCDSAEAALAIMRDQGGRVALVFSDVRLAGPMDGLQLASAIALLWPTARVVVTSGRRAERPPDLPPQAIFIPKPWRPFDLLVEAERATTERQPIVP
jgi:CheY-like chemotaxis protein